MGVASVMANYVEVRIGGCAARNMEGSPGELDGVEGIHVQVVYVAAAGNLSP